MEKYFSILILILISLLNLSNQATRNKVENLFGDLYDGSIYSGYLNTKIEGNQLFYIYIPSQSMPETDPLMLWLNGGPGCSSLFGMLAEIGPVISGNFEGKFKVNPYSWNKNANLLFIEQPAGVGFSKTSNPRYLWKDDDTAENLLAGVKDFFTVFTSLKNRPFYISGESYAGVYIPFLATHILEDTSTDKVNLKGVLIGNGLTDFDTDVERSMVEFGFHHGMVSTETYNKFKRNCPHRPDELTPEEDEQSNDSFYPRNVTKKCNEIRATIRDNLGGSDIYGIYRLCPSESRTTLYDPFNLKSHEKLSMKRTILEKLRQYKIKQMELNPNLNKEKLEALVPEEDVWPNGCGEDLFFDDFLNNDEIKKKLAIYDTSIEWSQCANVNYEMSDSYKFYSKTMLEHPDVQVWVFSGTEDGVLPTLGTMRWINKLGFTVETKWKKYYVGDQIAGYVQKYKEGLVIVTVKGAGHMVPQDQSASAYNMVTAFFKGVLP